MLNPVIERFLNKISVVNYGCWEWQRRLNENGYGILGIKSLPVLSHRFIYEYYYGNIDPKLVIDHLCKNKKCVNPIHLEEVTVKENNRRSYGEYILAYRKIIHHNSKKTHCKRGHEFTLENTFIKPNRARQCIECRNYLGRKYYRNLRK